MRTLFLESVSVMSHFNPGAQAPNQPPLDQPFPYHTMPQQIPSIVINPINSDKRSGDFQSPPHIRPQGLPSTSDPRLPAQIIYTVPGQRPPPFPSNFYPPMQTQPFFYSGPNQPGVVGQDDRFARGPIMSRFPGGTALQPLMLHQPTALRPPVSPPEMLPPLPVNELKTTFKPSRVKKNKKPKINKLGHEALEMQFAKKRQEKTLSEDTLDSLYADFQNTLKISALRRPLPSAYESNLEDELEAKLFDLFVQVISKSIDSFLPHECFQKIVSELSLHEDTKMILNSIFCLSSLILLRIDPDAIDSSYPLKYYQKTVGTIRYHLSRPDAEDESNGILARCLLATILLCIYELFFVAIDSTYVKGAASIFISIMSRRNRSESLIGNSPFYHSCFWAMFVCDMILSLKLELPSMYSLEKTWKAMDPVYFESFNDPVAHLDEPARSVKDVEAFLSSSLLTGQSTWWWQYKVIMTLSTINEFSNCYDVITHEDYKSNKEFHRWMELNESLEEINRNLPVSLKPSVCRPASKSRVFPHIFFKDEASAIVGLNYKMAKISHYNKLAHKLRVVDRYLVDEELAKYPPQYCVKLAKDLVGILQSYRNSHIWPVTIHALRAASRNIDKTDKNVMEELKRFTIRVIHFSHTHLDFVPSAP